LFYPNWNYATVIPGASPSKTLSLESILGFVLHRGNFGKNNEAGDDFAGVHASISTLFG
jgi:hypothetical protein